MYVAAEALHCNAMTELVQDLHEGKYGRDQPDVVGGENPVDHIGGQRLPMFDRVGRASQDFMQTPLHNS